ILYLPGHSFVASKVAFFKIAICLFQLVCDSFNLIHNYSAFRREFYSLTSVSRITHRAVTPVHPSTALVQQRAWPKGPSVRDSLPGPDQNLGPAIHAGFADLIRAVFAGDDHGVTHLNCSVTLPNLTYGSILHLIMVFA